MCGPDLCFQKQEQGQSLLPLLPFCDVTDFEAKWLILRMSLGLGVKAF